jgi:hypothetical protein
MALPRSAGAAGIDLGADRLPFRVFGQIESGEIIVAPVTLGIHVSFEV